MTKLTNANRPVRRETAVLERGRPLVVELWPRHLALWAKGERTKYMLPYTAMVTMAAWRQADEDRAVRARRRRRKEVEGLCG